MEGGATRSTPGFSMVSLVLRHQPREALGSGSGAGQFMQHDNRVAITNPSILDDLEIGMCSFASLACLINVRQLREYHSVIRS